MKTNQEIIKEMREPLSRGIIYECCPTATLELLAQGRVKDAHVRNAWEIVQAFGMPIIFTDTQLQYYTERCQYLSYIAVSYGSYYSPHRAIDKFIGHHWRSRLFWITNEITVMPPGKINRHRDSANCISNFVPDKNHGWAKYHTLNLNTLMMEKRRPLSEKKYGCIYYGTFRAGRVSYFSKYLGEEIFLSCHPKNHKKFKNAGSKAKMLHQMQWHKGRETLNHFQYSLYIEDEETHWRYNHLANRFYEALFCNCVTLFDISCEQTVELSGIKMREDFFVKDYEDLKNRINDGKFKERLKFQQEHWYEMATEQKTETLIKIGQILLNEQKGDPEKRDAKEWAESWKLNPKRKPKFDIIRETEG